MILAHDQRVVALGDNGRVLSVAWYRVPPAGALIVQRSALPEGDISQYRYVDGEFVHDPLPDPEPEAPAPTAEERIAALEQLAAEQDAALIELAALIGGGV